MVHLIDRLYGVEAPEWTHSTGSAQKRALTDTNRWVCVGKMKNSWSLK